MTKEEIKRKIDENNAEIEKIVDPEIFVFNPRVFELLEENEKLRQQCFHEFEYGVCKWCGAHNK